MRYLDKISDPADLQQFSERELMLLSDEVREAILACVSETGAVDELGKTVGKDRALDKVTYVSRFGMERAARLADEAEGRARELLGELPGDTSDLAAVTRFIHDRRR